MEKDNLPDILVDKPIILIQYLRLIQALAEIGFTIVINESEEYKIIPLKKKFGFIYRIGAKGQIKLSNIMEFNHEIPLIQFTDFIKPLIFPKNITDYCRKIWKNNRSYDILFIGLLTENRRSTIENWISSNCIENPFDKGKHHINCLSPFIKYIRDKLFSDQSLIIKSSQRGREFPIKSWDDVYYNSLAKSKFVLCPNGDWVWSYRFFESILCGAIPVVQDDCTLYEGFRYFRMSDDVDTLKWKLYDALYNYELCLERITMSIDQQQAVIDSVVAICN